MHVKHVSRNELTSNEDKENFKDKPETIFEAEHIEENLNDFVTKEVFGGVTSEEGILDLSVKKTFDDDSLTSVIVYENKNLLINNKYDKQMNLNK